MIDICKNNNLFIFNGRVGQDKNIGKFTFRDQSVIDYTLGTVDVLKLVSDFIITETDALVSDGHSILSTTLNISCSNLSTDQTTTTKSTQKWDE